MQRIRITIEIETKSTREIISALARQMAKLVEPTHDLVYLATEIAPTQETRRRNILIERD